jgi:hypothetical protein
MEGNPRSAGMRYPVLASIAWAVGAGLLIHLLATFLPGGWTPPLSVGLYVLFLVIWTLPACALLGLVLGVLLRFTVRRLGSRASLLRRNRFLLAAGYGILAGGGFFLIFVRLWVDDASLLSAIAGFCFGIAFVAIILPRPRLTA